MKELLNKNLSLLVARINSAGQGVAFHKGYTIFIEKVLPGERAKVKLIDCKKGYATSELLEITVESPERRESPCPHYLECGGCQIMHSEYPAQIEFKKEQLEYNLRRIGHFNQVDFVDSCIASPEEFSYRNKAQFPVQQLAGQLNIGFYKQGSHQLTSIDSCLIHSDLGNLIYTELKELLMKSNLSAYNERKHKGLLRHILIRTNLKNDQALLVFVCNGEGNSELAQIAEKLHSIHPEINGILINHNKQKGNTILSKNFSLLLGKDEIVEEMCDLKFKISAAAFFQVNTAQAQQLFLKAIEFAKLRGDENVLDAYCGTGSIGMIFAAHVKKVLGVDTNEFSIENAKANADFNQIDNIEFICGKSEQLVSELEDLDLVIMDPPRKGCHPDFLASLIENKIAKVIYISCDSATLARDLRILVDSGYQLESVTPFDMFPQSTHVESLSILNFKA